MVQCALICARRAARHHRAPRKAKARVLNYPYPASMVAARPRAGDKILVFKKRWRDLVLRRRKTMEIRGAALKPGRYWVGCRGEISGHVTLGAALPITDASTWASLRERHCVEDAALPYKRTFGLPVLSVGKITPLKYTHPRGALLCCAGNATCSCRM